jgi:hypothetical protein
MPLKIGDLELKAKLPQVPATMPVFEVSAPTLDERREGMRRLAGELKLGDLRSVVVEHGTIMAGKRGEVEYFHASGSVWARDAMSQNSAKNELRKWPGVKDGKRGPYRMTLDPESSRRLIGQARELVEASGLIGKEVASEAVQLDQVAHLDAKGKEIAHGAGQATVKFGYAVEGMPVRGAGAKTLVFSEPGRVAGAFHAWRPLGKATPVKLGSAEAALSVGLLKDPELELYHRAGHKIQITRLDLAYLALPAFMRQTHLFPALQIEGEVSKGKRGESFLFGRIHHAVAPRAYAAAEVFGPYLSVNPDGIAPMSPQNAA